MILRIFKNKLYSVRMLGISNYFWGSKKNDVPLTVAVAESVTAGALTNSISSEPGASKFFIGGITAYSIQSKKDILNINIKYAEQANFANPFTTSEMAHAVCKMFGARIGISTTGYSLPLQRAADIKNGLCQLNIENPYAYICLYDAETKHEIIKKVEFTYDINVPDKIQRASVQTKVALIGRRMYLTYIENIEKEKIIKDM